jgi:hypothetical protein
MSAKDIIIREIEQALETILAYIRQVVLVRRYF